MTNPTHPEQKPNEVFVGNWSIDEWPRRFNNIRSIRFGNIAYSPNGEILPVEEYLLAPMFVDLTELDKFNNIMSNLFYSNDQEPVPYNLLMGATDNG